MNEAAYQALLQRLGVAPGEGGHAVPTGLRPDRTQGPGSAPAEVARRSLAFRQQLDEWTASGRFGAPVLGLPGVAVRAGACISCGELLAEGRAWRCAVCLRAVEIVLGLEPAP